MNEPLKFYCIFCFQNEKRYFISYDNDFSVVYKGMKVAYKMFPEGLITGSPPPVVSETPRPPTEMHMAEKSQFDQSDMDNLNVYLDSQLMDKSSGSKWFILHT